MILLEIADVRNKHNLSVQFIFRKLRMKTAILNTFIWI
jgi:hypothetical protein